MHKLDLDEDIQCVLCLESEELVEHILCHCPAGEWTRFSIFSKTYLLSEDLDRNSFNKDISFIKRLNLLKEVYYGCELQQTTKSQWRTSS